MTRLAVFGNPVLHSLSPPMWDAALKDAAIRGTYLRINPGDPANIPFAMNVLKLDGANVTAPYKGAIHRLGIALTGDAKPLDAANTLVPGEDGWRGWNTDPYGVIHALEERGLDLRSMEVAVLGAGGAGRAVVHALREARASSVTLFNRNRERGEQAADRLGVPFMPLERLADSHTFGLIVNTIDPRKWSPSADEVSPGTWYFPAVYAADSLTSHKNRIDPKRWLVHQGAESFRLIFGGDPVEAMGQGLSQSSAPDPSGPVVLFGFMGSGKSTVGARVARLLDRPFVDTDEAIEDAAGMSIPEIFRSEGEAGFRQREAEAAAAVPWSDSPVVSLGGGAIGHPGIRRRVAESAVGIWLLRDPEAVCTPEQVASRPMLSKEQDPVARARALFNERVPLYAEIADIVVVNRGGGIDETTTRIVNELRPGA